MESISSPTVPRFPKLLSSGLELFTVEEIAEALRLTDVTVRRLIQDELLVGYKFGGAFRVTREDFSNFIVTSRVPKPGL